MLPPILPNPIMPSCICSLFGVHSCASAFSTALQAFKRCEAAFYFAQVDAQGPPLAFHQHLKISASLRRLHHSKREFLAGHRKVRRVVAGHLQEHAAVGAALIRLAGRMQEARPKSETGGHVLRVSRTFVRISCNIPLCGVVHFDIREQREIIARASAGSSARADSPQRICRSPAA